MSATTATIPAIYYGFDNHATAWQLTAGVRPISPLGIEYDYIQFGSPNGYIGSSYDNGSTTRANALFAVGYLPLPVPFLDVYAKLGVARLQIDTTVFDSNGAASRRLHELRPGLWRRRAIPVLESRAARRVRAHQRPFRRS